MLNFVIYMVLNFFVLISFILGAIYAYVGFDLRRRFLGEEYKPGFNLTKERIKEEYEIADRWWKNR